MANEQLFSNNAVATLTQELTNSANTISGVLPAEVALFGASTIASGDHEYAALNDGVNIEIIKIIDITADVFTVVRAQEGTTAVAFSIGATFYGSLTANTISTITASISTITADISINTADISINTADILDINNNLLNSIVTASNEVIVDSNGNVVYTV